MRECPAWLWFILAAGLNVYFRLNTLLPPAIDDAAPASFWQDEQGVTYLLEVDPYRWRRRIENYLASGIFGAYRLGNRDYDGLMNAPWGNVEVEPIPLHYYIGAYAYKFLHFFNPGITLMHALALVPVLLSVLIVVMIFSIGAALGLSPVSRCAASLIAGLAPPVLMRTSFGWFDTDIYNMCVPPAITLCLAHAFKVNKMSGFVWALTAGLLIGVYSALWNAWWCIFYILMGGCAAYMLYAVFSGGSDRDFRIRAPGEAAPAAVFFVCACLSVVLISGARILKHAWGDVIRYFFMRTDMAIGHFWPGVAFSIAEIQKADAGYLLRSIGGPAMAYGAFLGILLSFFHTRYAAGSAEARTVPAQRRFLICVLLVWMFSMLAASHMARRFCIFLAVPVSLFFGIWMDGVFGILEKMKKKTGSFFSRAAAYNAYRSGIVCAVILIPVSNAAGFLCRPHVNDASWNMLTRIYETTPRGAIINSDWVWGDYIMTIARRATVHCASELAHSPVSYWMARVWLSRDEKESRGILRMLDAGGTRAFEEVARCMRGDKIASLELLNKLLIVTPREGEVLLREKISDEAAIERIRKFVYMPDHPGYLLVHNELIGTLWAMERLQKWDFKKFQWISARTHAFYKLSLANTISAAVTGDYKIEDDLFFNPNTRAVRWRDEASGQWIEPALVREVSQEGCTDTVFTGKDQRCAVMVMRDAQRYTLAVMSRDFIDSMLVRLYFMRGQGLRYFERALTEERPEYNIRLYLYKIKWGDD